jgi:hypothetical protein
MKKIPRRFTKEVMLRDHKAHYTTEEVIEHMKMGSSPIPDHLIEWMMPQRAANLEFLNNCSSDLVFMMPDERFQEAAVTQWCQSNAKAGWGKLQLFKYWWFESVADADAFEAALC